MNQASTKELKGTELIYLSFLLAICLAASAVILSGAPKREESARALWRAESLALQLQQVRVQNEARLSTEIVRQEGRMPATLDLSREQVVSLMKPFQPSGEIGTDPWGQPYQYQVLNHSSGSYILVWSVGVDREPNIEPLAILTTAAEGHQVAFRGDDLGMVLPLD